MASKTEIKPDQEIPSLTKRITTDSILQFESCGILDRENIHNNPELAAKRLGTTYTIASGRMSIDIQISLQQIRHAITNSCGSFLFDRTETADVHVRCNNLVCDGEIIGRQRGKNLVDQFLELRNQRTLHATFRGEPEDIEFRAAQAAHACE